MEFDIFYSLLWITAILLVVSGIDDMFMDAMYWLTRKKYNRTLPSLGNIKRAPEKPIALIIGAWQEEKVIGRTLAIALSKIRYSNFKIFVGVYPNDANTIKIVKEFADKDDRVVVCINTKDGPTSKADNLNNVYKCIKKVEEGHGDFGVLLIHDSEDFIHPLSLKLYNYMIMYKGHHGVQIPVIPIKSPVGKLFHRTYCDAFAELHTKDMIVRQTINSFIPFAGTGMAFSRKIFGQLERENKRNKMKNIKTKYSDFKPFDESENNDSEQESFSKHQRLERKYNNRRRKKSFEDSSPLTGWDSRNEEYKDIIFGAGMDDDDYSIFTGDYSESDGISAFNDDGYNPYKGIMGSSNGKSSKKDKDLDKEELFDEDEDQDENEFDEEIDGINDSAKSFTNWLNMVEQKENPELIKSRISNKNLPVYDWEVDEDSNNKFENEYSPISGWNASKRKTRNSKRYDAFPSNYENKKNSSAGVRKSMLVMMVLIIGLLVFIYMKNIKPSNANELVPPQEKISMEFNSSARSIK